MMIKNLDNSSFFYTKIRNKRMPPLIQISKVEKIGPQS